MMFYRCPTLCYFILSRAVRQLGSLWGPRLCWSLVRRSTYILLFEVALTSFMARK
jgi:hypothetical protein